MKIETENNWNKNSEVTTYITVFAIWKQYRHRGFVIGVEILNVSIELIFESTNTKTT